MKPSSDNRIPPALLQPTETVLWTGQPNPISFALISLPTLPDVFIAFALISIGAFMIFHVEHYMVLPIVVEQFSFLLIVAGHVQILFAPAVGYFTARGMLYALTDQRLLVINALNGRINQQFGHGDLTLPETVVTTDGCVYFAHGPIETPDGRRRQLGFEHIPDAGKVAELIDKHFRQGGRKDL